MKAVQIGLFLLAMLMKFNLESMVALVPSCHNLVLTSSGSSYQLALNAGDKGGKVKPGIPVVLGPG